jgi:hypothetical protein
MDFGEAPGDSLSPLHFTPYALYTIQKEEHKKNHEEEVIKGARKNGVAHGVATARLPWGKVEAALAARGTSDSAALASAPAGQPRQSRAPQPTTQCKKTKKPFRSRTHS